MSSDLLASRDSQGSWQSSRATLFREDAGAGLLGPMKARRLEMGDLLSSNALDLVGSLPQGRGFNVDNFPVTYGLGSRPGPSAVAWWKAGWWNCSRMTV